jgi:hypothetical protein
MAQVKELRSKHKKIPPAQAENDEEQEGPIALTSTKNKKPIEIEEPEAILPVDEKVADEDSPAVTEDEESVSEEVALDDEEVNPFGDKWEE